MKSERQPDQSISSNEEVNPEDAGVKPAARRIAYKTVLAVVVIGILIISVLWMFVISREETQVNATLATDPDMKVHETSISNGLQVAGIEDQIGPSPIELAKGSKCNKTTVPLFRTNSRT